MSSTSFQYSYTYWSILKNCIYYDSSISIILPLTGKIVNFYCKIWILRLPTYCTWASNVDIDYFKKDFQFSRRFFLFIYSFMCDDKSFISELHLLSHVHKINRFCSRMSNCMEFSAPFLGYFGIRKPYMLHKQTCKVWLSRTYVPTDVSLKYIFRKLKKNTMMDTNELSN